MFDGKSEIERMFPGDRKSAEISYPFGSLFSVTAAM